MDGSRRIGLRLCDPWDQRQYRSARCEMQEISTVTLHAITRIILGQYGLWNVALALVARCPLLGVKRTSIGRRTMSASDPKQTWAPQDCCRANWPLNPISPVVNPCCNRWFVLKRLGMLGDGLRTARLRGHPKTIRPLPVQSSPDTSSRWLKVGNAIQSRLRTVRFFISRNEN